LTVSRSPQHPIDVSVVIVAYNMAREIPRTLLSLSASYQCDISADDYEVIVVDNGSTPPLDPAVIGNLKGNFQLIRIDPAPPSPAHAINRGLAAARGKIVGVMIDGARIVTPGLLHFARQGACLYRRAVVATLPWHLGPDIQERSAMNGYDKRREDALLQSIAWPADGYRLFDISTIRRPEAYFAPIAETNTLFLHRDTWDCLGGYDERFDEPAGGLVNMDTFRRAVELPDAALVILLGEAAFHQLHGSAGTNPWNSQSAENRKSHERGINQYKSIRGHHWSYAKENRPRTYLGTLPGAALAAFTSSAALAAGKATQRGAVFHSLIRKAQRAVGQRKPTF
jgi:glycosyltransferase involved in cell wall biosynthesis